MSEPERESMEVDVLYVGAGPANLASSMATDASQMFARNVLSFLGEFVKDGQISLDFENEVISGSCITHDGHIVHERTRQAMGEE